MKKLVSLVLVALLVVAFAAPTLAARGDLGQNAPYGKITVTNVTGTATNGLSGWVSTVPVQFANSNFYSRFIVVTDATVKAGWDAFPGAFGTFVSPWRTWIIEPKVTQPTIDVEFFVGNGFLLKGTSVTARLRITAAGVNGYTKYQPAAPGWTLNVGASKKWTISDLKAAESYNIYGQIKAAGWKSFKTVATATVKSRGNFASGVLAFPTNAAVIDAARAANRGAGVVANYAISNAVS